MSIDAFVIRHDSVGRIFATAFLASPDFDKDTIKVIARLLDVGRSKSERGELIDCITPIFDTVNLVDAAKIVIEKLVSRRRDWAAVKTGEVKIFPRLAAAEELVWARGDDRWYGPVHCYADHHDAAWYIRPVFIKHWEPIETEKNQLREVTIRWLCFARAMPDSLSLHWRGFSYYEKQDDAASDPESSRMAQFPYWRFIPALFAEIEELTKAAVHDLNLHNLILYKMWDRYRGKTPYRWKDTRIRAESSGVALNAHAAGIQEINPVGIRHLASTIRRAVQNELRDRYSMEIPDPDHVDEIILRTLIREYGTQSYGFRLENQSGVVFEAHSYFGLRPTFKSPDSLTHMRFSISKCHNFRQLAFLLDNWRGSVCYEEPEYRTIPLF